MFITLLLMGCGEARDSEEEEITKVQKVNTKAIILVHGLNSGSSTWSVMAEELSRQLGITDGTYVEIGMEIEINSSAKCWDAYGVNEAIPCTQLTDIEAQDTFRKVHRSQAQEYIFGLDKNQFKVSNIAWRLNNDSSTHLVTNSSDKYKTFSQHRVFVVNFSNNNQLTYDAQGAQLKEAIDDISNILDIDEYILIGHSMGGLASRAYIQNETTQNISKLITINTPHLGGKSLATLAAGTYTVIGKNAAVNLASDSKALSKLNAPTAIANKYEGVEVHHLGYSDGLYGADALGYGEDYYSESDGIVDIGSQMGLDALNPYRVIFSPTIKEGVVSYENLLDNTIDNQANRTVPSTNYGIIDLHFDLTLAHTMVLHDYEYIYYILQAIDKSGEAIEFRYATLHVHNTTDFTFSRDGIYQLYIRNSGSSDWGEDLIEESQLSIASQEQASFQTLKCDRYVDIKATGFLGDPVWEQYSLYLPCEENSDITILFSQD